MDERITKILLVIKKKKYIDPVEIALEISNFLLDKLSFFLCMFKRQLSQSLTLFCDFFFRLYLKSPSSKHDAFLVMKVTTEMEIHLFSVNLTFSSWLFLLFLFYFILFYLQRDVSNFISFRLLCPLFSSVLELFSFSPFFHVFCVVLIKSYVVSGLFSAGFFFSPKSLAIKRSH